MPGTRLVINADELGLHPRIDEGVLLAAAEGVVRSVSVLVTGEHASDAVARARAQKLGLGVHWSLSGHLTPAAPAMQVRALAPGGRFRKDWREFALAWTAGLIPLAEVERELYAQLESARALGFEPDHLDSHQHLHLMPGIRHSAERIAAELAVPLRWPSERPALGWIRHPRTALKSSLLDLLTGARPVGIAQRVVSIGEIDSAGLTEPRLLSRIRTLPNGDVELRCHPGRDPGERIDGFAHAWETELAALTSPGVKQAIADAGVSLCRFSELR